MSESPVIRATGLGRRFRGHRVLRDVNLSVDAGEIVGLLGADGAGKTTLMQMLAAILDPSEGRCEVLGFDTVQQAGAVTARIGYMSQGFSLYDRLSVEENLRFAARIRGVTAEAYRRRRAELLAMAGLERFTERPAGKLSGGMRKKLSLCTNLIHEPRVLILDEPSLGVDPPSRRDLWRLLRRAREAGAAIVLTTPYMDEAAQCDRVAYLAEGRILACGSPEALASHAEGLVYLLRGGSPTLAEATLTSMPTVRAVQWLPEGLRFQLTASAHADAVLADLRRLGDLAPVPAELEDGFVALSDAPHAAAVGEAAAVPSLGASTAGAPVRVDDVTVRFGAFTAVDGVSLVVRAGEVIGWLGPNGAGKTTLIRVLCGLLRPTSGAVEVAGVDVIRASLRVRERIGYMSQRFSLYPDLTVAENLAFFAGVYGIAVSARPSAIRSVSRTTGIDGYQDRPTGALSGALRQRLALACAIMHRPRVLFLDEPTSGVDPLARQRFWRLIQSLATAGATVFVTTHYLEEARYCNRLGLMHRGRLLALGTAARLRAALGLAEDAAMEDVFMAFLAREES